MKEPNARVAEAVDAYLRALEAGEAPDREAILARHKDVAEELALALDSLDFVHRATRELAADDEDAGPGKELGDFRLVREIGRGGMAVVYEAEQVSLGRRVALKVLPFAAVLDPKQLQRFKNEAMAAAHLRHPNIVPVYGVGCERGVHYYAMQYVEGQSLAAAIGGLKGGGAGEGAKTPISSHGSNREPAYIRMAVALGKQAAEALDHAHELGIVHRDVKPGNLLVDEAGTVWITDFGLARSVADAGLTITGELLGTIRYMSPEQALAKRVPIDHRTDVYSLGATLYELLTLEPAFPGDDPHAVIQDIASKEPALARKLNPALPRDIETVLLKAMAKDPSGRYATAQEMADDLGRYLEDMPVVARRPSLAARAARWSRRHRGLVAASLAVLLLGIAALAADNFRVSREQRKTRAALDKADAALKRAELNLGLARGAVDQFLVEAGTMDTGERPLPPAARQVLLVKALEFYESAPEDRESIVNRIMILHALHRYGDALAVLDGALLTNDAQPAGNLIIRGHMLWHLARLDEAMTALDHAVEIDPNQALVHSFRSEVLLELRRPEEALAALDRAIELDPGNAAAHSQRGLALGQHLGRFEEALAAHDRALEIDPTSAAHHAMRSHALHSLGRFDEALATGDRAIQLDPGLDTGHACRGNALQSRGRFSDALAAYDRAIEIDPVGTGMVHMNRGCALRRLGRPEDALAAHDRAIEINRRNSLAHAGRGNVLLDLERPAEALEAFDCALEIDPREETAHTGRGCALQDLGRYAEAVAAHREAIRIRPDDASAHLNLGCALYAKGDYDGAAGAFREAARLKPDYAEAHFYLGNALGQVSAYHGGLTSADVTAGNERKRNLEGAIAAYGEAIRIRPDWADVRGNLGALLWLHGDVEGAIREFRAVVRLTPEDATAHSNLGAALAVADEYDDAITSCREAIRLKPDDALPHINLSRSLLGKGDPAAAAEEAREAVRLQPEHAEAHLTLGAALRDHDPDGAIRAYRDAIRLRPDHAKAHCDLGLALKDRGLFREAATMLRRGFALGSPRLSEKHVEAAERNAELEGRLDKVLSGEERPRDARECAEFAWILYAKARHEESARMYADALAGDASLADDLVKGHRYNAACSAVLAAAGGGADPAHWRAMAFEWLRADLAARRGTQDLARDLAHWKRDPDFGAVRDRIAELPGPERDQWTRLWADVDALLANARD